MFNPIKIITGLLQKGARSQALAKILGILGAAATVIHDNGIHDFATLLAALKSLGLGWLGALILDKAQAAGAASNEAKLAIARAEIQKVNLSQTQIAQITAALPTGAIEPRHYAGT